MSENLQEIEKKIKQIVLNGGDILRRYWGQRGSLAIDYKEGQGLVSKADKETEKYIINELKELLPNASFCAEESSFENGFDQKKLEKGYCWMIDPLDGTNNFLSGFDYFSISVALAFDGLPVIGIVYRPLRGDLFSAVKNKGAFYENVLLDSEKEKIEGKLNRPHKLKDALLCTGFAGEKGISFEREFEVFKKVMFSSRGIRRLGSAALDLCYLAKGSWHGFWEKGLAPWDVAAGGLICLEAGLKVENLEGESFSPFNKTIISCCAEIKQELLTTLNQ